MMHVSDKMTNPLKYHLVYLLTISYIFKKIWINALGTVFVITVVNPKFFHFIMDELEIIVMREVTGISKYIEVIW